LFLLYILSKGDDNVSFSYSVKEMNEMHKSALQEIGNIGMGNATKSLAFILDNQLKLDLPSVEFLEFDKMSDFLDGQDENIVLSAITSITGEINGTVVLVIRKNFAMRILQKILPGDDSEINIDDLNELQTSALNELCNIFIGSYTSAVATFLDADIKISLPYVCIDMLGAVLSSVAVELFTYYDNILVVNNYIESEDEESFHMFYLPDEESYEKIMLKLGIQNE
jgi:chemotaxis protein CheC